MQFIFKQTKKRTENVYVNGKNKLKSSDGVRKYQQSFNCNSRTIVLGYISEIRGIETKSLCEKISENMFKNFLRGENRIWKKYIYEYMFIYRMTLVDRPNVFHWKQKSKFWITETKAWAIKPHRNLEPWNGLSYPGKMISQNWTWKIRSLNLGKYYIVANENRKCDKHVPQLTILHSLCRI